MESQQEIEQWMKENHGDDAFSDHARSVMAKKIAQQNRHGSSLDTKRFYTVTEDEKGNRVIGVQDNEGHFFGKGTHINLYEDAHGNIMGHDTKTGERRKILDKDDR